MATLAQASLTPHELRVVERFVSLLAGELGHGLISVWLYGSRARGEQPGTDSDIDILVLTRNGRKDLGRVVSLASEAALAEPHPFVLISARAESPGWVEERRAIDDFFIQEIDRDKLVLFGRP